MTLRLEVEHAGLTFEGTYEYEAPTGPTYSCGGTPGGTWVEILSMYVDDPDGDWAAELADYVGPGAARLASGLARLGVALPRSVSDWLMSHYEEDALDRLAEEGADWEPDYPEYEPDDDF